jgi:hypothetical protein
MTCHDHLIPKYLILRYAISMFDFYKQIITFLGTVFLFNLVCNILPRTLRQFQEQGMFATLRHFRPGLESYTMNQSYITLPRMQIHDK